MKGDTFMNDLTIVNSLEQVLKPGNSAIVYQSEELDEFALIVRKNNRTHITLLDDIEKVDSKVMRAFKDEQAPTFSIDNEVLNSIINRSSTLIEDLIVLLAYYENIGQDVVNVLMEKILQLSSVYAPEYIISEIRKLSQREFELFIKTDDTYGWFKENISI